MTERIIINLPGTEFDRMLLHAQMKAGIKVEFYTEHKRWTQDKGGIYRDSIRWHKGILIQFDELICKVLPDGKTKAIVVPTNQVQVRK